jgi:hypothetical protein
MECPNCHEPTEDGAAFCGNCGHALRPAATLTAALPAYAIAAPAKRTGQTTALLSVLLGAAGIAGAVFIAVFGLAFGVAGLVLGTLSRHSPKRALNTGGLVISTISVLAGLGVLVYTVHHDPKLNKITPVREQGPVAVTSAANLSTPCYSANIAQEMNISRAADGCDTQLYNGRTFEASSEVYKINASQSRVRTQSGFNTLAKQALENDVKTNLKTFTVTGQKETSFAGSPAYIITAVDKANNIAVIEAAVYHQSPTGDNIFILLHGNNGEQSDLQVLEAQWQWK